MAAILTCWVSPVELGWPEVAEFNRNVVDTCLAGGTLSYRNKELVLLRDGIPEDVWLDLYYSPVADDDGKPAGVMAMVVETTEHVISERRRQAAEDAYRADNERVRLALNAGALLGSFVWDIKANRLSGDERFARTFSFPADQDLADLPPDVAEARIHPDDLSWVQEQVNQSVETGEPLMRSIACCARMAVICGCWRAAVASLMSRANRSAFPAY